MNDKMQPFENNWPVPTALCVFRAKTGLMFLGYLLDEPIESGEQIKLYGKEDYLTTDLIKWYQYVVNEQGGFIFMTPKCFTSV